MTGRNKLRLVTSVVSLSRALRLKAPWGRLGLGLTLCSGKALIVVRLDLKIGVVLLNRSLSLCLSFFPFSVTAHSAFFAPTP